MLDSTKDADVEAASSDRVRREGGRRPRLVDADRDPPQKLAGPLSSEARGDPTSPLGWRPECIRELAKTLREMGHQVSLRTVGQSLYQIGHSLQATAKTLEGTQRGGRDAECRDSDDEVTGRLAAGEPVAAVHTEKKNELVVGMARVNA